MASTSSLTDLAVKNVRESTCQASVVQGPGLEIQDARKDFVLKAQGSGCRLVLVS